MASSCWVRVCKFTDGNSYYTVYRILWVGNKALNCLTTATKLVFCLHYFRDYFRPDFDQHKFFAFLTAQQKNDFVVTDLY